MIDHHKRENLINHINKSKACKEYILSCPQVLTEFEADALDMSNRPLMRQLQGSGQRRHYNKQVAVRVPGPLPPRTGIVVGNTSPLGRGYNHRYLPPCDDS